MSFKKQIALLCAGVNRMLNFDFETEIPIITRDEAGVLAQTLNKTALLYRRISMFSNKKTAKLALENLIPKTHTASKTAVLCCGIHSFFDSTDFSRHPVELVNSFEMFFDMIERCAGETGGHIDSFFMDKVVIHWGLFDNADESECVLSAARCALLLRACLADWNAKHAEKSGTRTAFSFGIDLNYAYLSLYNVGGAFYYYAQGRALDGAFRCEALSHSVCTDITLSPAAFRLIEPFAAVQGFQVAPPEAGRVYALINIRGAKQSERLASILARFTGLNLNTAFSVVGPQGPRTLKALQEALQLKKLKNTPQVLRK